MGSSGNLGLALFFLALCLEGSVAQSGCTIVLFGMSSCLNYVTGISKTPSSSCCSSLAIVVKSQPQCLCTALNGTLGININITIALGLPSACDVKTPPVSGCNAGNNGPAMAPVGSPKSSMAPVGSPKSSMAPVGSPKSSPTSTFIAGSKNNETSDAGSDKKMHYVFLWGLLAVVALT